MTEQTKSATSEPTPDESWYDWVLDFIRKDPSQAERLIHTMEEQIEELRPAVARKLGGATRPEIATANGADQRSAPQPVNGPARTPIDHGLSRNQLSKVRGVYLMDALTGGAPNYSLADIHAALMTHGFEDEYGKALTEAAVRSHLFRLKQSGHVAIPSSGVYTLTSDGFEHLQRERAAQKPLIDRFRGHGE